MNKLLMQNSHRMTPKQLEAEKMAITMLTKAQHLLMESDKNVEEAQKIRNEVTQELLPSHNLYIVRKDSRSLLLDVDRKIQQAFYRKYSLSKKNRIKNYIYSGEEGHKQRNQNYLEKRKERRNERYNQVVELTQQQNQKSLIWMVAIVITSVVILYGIQEFVGQNTIYNSFSWIEKYR